MLKTYAGHARRAAVACALVFATTGKIAPAHAGIVYQDFAGHVTAADAGNPLGVAAGDPIQGRAVYDDALVQVLDFFPAIQLTFSIGGLVFTETDDDDYPSLPLVIFDNQQLIGFEYLAHFSLGAFGNLAFDVVGTDVFVTDDDDSTFPNLVIGEITAFGPPQPVPLPAALPLFAAGLAVFIAARRRAA